MYCKTANDNDSCYKIVCCILFLGGGGRGIGREQSTKQLTRPPLTTCLVAIIALPAVAIFGVVCGHYC